MKIAYHIGAPNLKITWKNIVPILIIWNSSPKFENIHIQQINQSRESSSV